jgi:hypothetical protein
MYTVDSFYTTATKSGTVTQILVKSLHQIKKKSMILANRETGKYPYKCFVMIKIIHPTRCKSFTSLLPDVYVWLNTIRASPRPLSGAHNCTRSLWFYGWREAAGA